MATETRHGDLQQPTAKTRIGSIVALSMAAGLIVAVVLIAAPFVPVTDNALTGVVLLGFALGWALLAVLSTRFSDQAPTVGSRASGIHGAGRHRFLQRVRCPAHCAGMGMAPRRVRARLSG